MKIDNDNTPIVMRGKIKDRTCKPYPICAD